MLPGHPGLRGYDIDTEFFVEFAHECLVRAFVVFNLATWKFPAASRRFAFRTFGHEYAAILALQHADGYVDHRIVSG